MKYTVKQSKALSEFNNPDKIYYLCDGGSRSGKSWLVCKYIITKALKYPGTRHLICRQSKTSCINTVWKQTLLGILANYDKRLWVEDKSNRIINFVNGSSIWAGGFDNKLHEDAVLGSEYATVFVNEALDMNYPTFSKLRTRLNWKNVSLKFFLDCNPKAPSHWVSKFFIKQIDPEDNKKLAPSIASKIHRIRFHPLDNQENLSAEYLEQLKNLRGLAKSRFWLGEWAEDIEGLVYHAFERKVNIVDEPIEPIIGAETFTAWDFGASDNTAIIIGQILPVPKSIEYIEGYRINILGEYTNRNKSYDHYATWLQRSPWWGMGPRHYGDPAGTASDAKLESWIYLLGKYGISIEYTTRYKTIEERADAGNAIMPYIRICEKQCPRFVEALENWKYPLGDDGKKKPGSKPEHNEFSHFGTAFYYMACCRFGGKGGGYIV